jgi:hypothetical protein
LVGGTFVQPCEETVLDKCSTLRGETLDRI